MEENVKPVELLVCCTFWAWMVADNYKQFE